MMNILDRLRTETRPHHQRVDNEMRLEERLASPVAYRHLLERFYGFHLVWEQAVATSLNDKVFFDPRRKLARLAADLTHLGLSRDEMARIPSCVTLEPFPDQAAAFGSLYVIEGSTLGGKLIAKMVSTRLGIGPDDGGAYFNGYGPDTGAMWAAFRNRLTEISSPDTDARIVAFASHAFEAIRLWVCAAPRV